MFKHMHAYAHSVCNRGGAIAQIREVLLSESIMIDPGIENPLEDFMAALVTTITLSVFHDAAHHSFAKQMRRLIHLALAKCVTVEL